MSKRKIILLSTLISTLTLVCLLAVFLIFAESGRLTVSSPEDIISETAESETAVSEAASGEHTSSGEADFIQTPEPTPEPAFEEYDITLMALGDNLMHMGIVNTGRMDDGTYDYSFLFQSMKEYLDSADIKIINQETILGGNHLGFSGFPLFNSPTEVGDAIADAGFNVVLHATNHAADQGIDGINNCVAFWETHPEVLMTGIAGETPADEIPLLDIGGITFAILNYTYGPNMETLPYKLMGHLNMLCAYDENTGRIDFTALNPRVTEDIEKAKELADIVIVCPHWGTEYQDKPSSYQQKFALEMTEVGADLIIGTHPHVPQPVEWITSENGNTALCYYSLGNYVSTQKEPLCMLEGMAWVTFHVTENDVSLSEKGSGVLPLVCHYKSGPVRLENVYLLEDYTEELASRHGIRNYGGVTLNLGDLQTWSADIFGDFLLKKSDILKISDPVDSSGNFPD